MRIPGTPASIPVKRIPEAQISLPVMRVPVIGLALGTLARCGMDEVGIAAVVAVVEVDKFLFVAVIPFGQKSRSFSFDGNYQQLNGNWTAIILLNVNYHKCP